MQQTYRKQAILSRSICIMFRYSCKYNIGTIGQVKILPWLNLAQRDRNGQRRRMILWPVKIPFLSKTSFCSHCGLYFARAGSVARTVTTGQYRLLNVMTVFLNPWTGHVAVGHPDSPSSSLSINSQAIPMYLTAGSLSNANSPVSPSRTSPHH